MSRAFRRVWSLVLAAGIVAGSGSLASGGGQKAGFERYLFATTDLCRQDADCRFNDLCVNGDCKPRTGACQSSAQCPGSSVRTDGRCRG